jgi:regulator of protease activity HflC (stomatin/prohibitin superfamily)
VIVAIFVLIALSRSIKVVPPNKQLVVSRLGRVHAVHISGLAVLVPFIDRGEWIDKQITTDIHAQKISLKENEPVNLNLTIAYNVIDPLKAVSNVADYKYATSTLSETEIRKYCSELTLADLLNERSKTQDRVREAINVVAQQWGINVTDFSIQYVDVPEAVQQELKRKAEAERLRRLME